VPDADGAAADIATVRTVAAGPAPRLLRLPDGPRHARGARGVWLASWLPGIVVLLGLAVRAEQYVYRRSLWFDETLLALNVVHRSYARLLEPLAYSQGAPPGFLSAQRTAVLVFGSNEYALRLVPFLGGCLALVVFAHLSYRLLSRPAALTATALFALSPFLVYYSSEGKQYSTDVLFVVLLLDLAVGLLRGPVRPTRVCAFGLAAVVAVLCSHPAVFVAAGASTVLLLTYFARREWNRLAWLAAASALWAASFAVEYLLILRPLAGDRALLAYWQAGFPPTPLALDPVAGWLGAALWRLVRDLAGFPLAGLAIALGMAGAVAIARRGASQLAMVLAPLPVVVGAAVLHRYPLDGRLALFLVPVVLLLVAAAIDLVPLRAGRRVAGPVVAGVLVALVAAQPAGRTLRAFTTPIAVSETRPLLEAISARWQPGDQIALETSAEPAYWYYAPRLGLPARPEVVALRRRPCNGPPIAPELLQPRRLWLVLSAWPHSAFAPTKLTTPLVADAQPEERSVLAHIPGGMRPAAVLRTPGAAAYLVETGTAASFEAPRSCTRLVPIRPRVPPTALAE
jgi:hypothetical protein